MDPTGNKAPRPPYKTRAFALNPAHHEWSPKVNSCIHHVFWTPPTLKPWLRPWSRFICIFKISYFIDALEYDIPIVAISPVFPIIDVRVFFLQGGNIKLEWNTI
jgi:hypothetical protein